MRKIFRMMAVVAMTFVATACYDDDDLWNKVDELETKVEANAADIATLSALVDALNQGKIITATEQTEDGYVLTFNDGSQVEVKNGKNGTDGINGSDGKDGDSFFVSIEEKDGIVVITLADGRVIELPKVTYRILTFEDVDAKFTPFTIEGCGTAINTWSDLIDNPQYGGLLIYNDYSYTGYKWYDEGNTGLASEIIDGGPFWNGGHVISNYYAVDFKDKSYMDQLTVSVGAEGAAGHNGSKNFCVQNGYVDENSWKTTLPSFYFADGIARVIDHMYVVNTSYTLNSLTYGDSFAAAAGENTWFKIVATGYDATENETGTAEFYLCNGKDNIVKDWTKFELSSLGKVVKVTFNLKGSDDLSGSYGLNTPAYFAYDDVAVRF